MWRYLKLSTKLLAVCIIVALIIVSIGTWLYIWIQIKKIECSITAVRVADYLTNDIRKRGERSSISQEDYYIERDKLYAYPSEHFPESYFKILGQSPNSFYGIEIELNIKNGSPLIMQGIQLDTDNPNCLWIGTGFVFEGYILNLPYYAQGKKETTELIRIILFDDQKQLDQCLINPSLLKLFISFHLGLFRLRIPVNSIGNYK